MDLKEDIKYLPDGAWLRYYEEDGQTWTVQHCEAFDGKLKLNPEWEIVEDEIGKVYIVKPKQI